MKFRQKHFRLNYEFISVFREYKYGKFVAGNLFSCKYRQANFYAEKFSPDLLENYFEYFVKINHDVRSLKRD